MGGEAFNLQGFNLWYLIFNEFYLTYRAITKFENLSEKETHNSENSFSTYLYLQRNDITGREKEKSSVIGELILQCGKLGVLC